MSAETVLFGDLNRPSQQPFDCQCYFGAVDNDCLTTKAVNKTKTVKQFLLLEIKFKICIYITKKNQKVSQANISYLHLVYPKITKTN